MKLELMDFIELENYPSGSGIEFYNDRIYLIGDDAADLLVMTKKWSNPVFISLDIPAENKQDGTPHSELEAMTVLSIDKKPHLLIIGSGTGAHRNRAALLNLKNNAVKWLDLGNFYKRVAASGIPAVNIEGIAEVYDYLVFVNRGSLQKPGNHLVITRSDFWKDQEKTSLQLIFIDFESVAPAGTALGVSGLTYSDKHEDLFLTITTDAAPGEKSKSYLGVIENLYRKIGREKGKIKVNHLIDLEAADSRFAGYKMESVAIQSEKDHSVKMQVVADNDEGKTYLFKVWLGW